eukprot:scaffold3044_cov176-Ochromonas_danica.AAC.3
MAEAVKWDGKKCSLVKKADGREEEEEDGRYGRSFGLAYRNKGKDCESVGRSEWTVPVCAVRQTVCEGSGTNPQRQREQRGVVPPFLRTFHHHKLWEDNLLLCFQKVGKMIRKWEKCTGPIIPISSSTCFGALNVGQNMKLYPKQREKKKAIQ